MLVRGNGKNIKIWLGLSLSLIFLTLALKNLDFSLFFKTLMNIKVTFVLISISVFLIGYIVKASRWVFLLRPIDRNISLRTSAPAFFISFAANNLLPLRAGELIRAIVIGHKRKISKSAALGTVFMERVADGLGLLLILAFCLFFIRFPGWAKIIGYFAFLLFFSLVLVVVFSVYKRNSLLKLFDRFLSLFPSKISIFFHRITDSFFEGFSSVKDFRTLIVIFVLTIIVWGVEALMYFILALSFDFNLSYINCLFVLSILNLGIIIPSGPSYLGPFELFCVKSLGVFDITQSRALSYTLVLHISQFIPIVTAGLIFLWIEGLSLKKLSIYRER